MKCVVPSCPNEEETTKLRFFAVPQSCDRAFKKWTAHFFLSGLRYEKICERHFIEDDFRKYERQELKPKAIPCVNLPDQGPKVTPAGAAKCCITGCRTTLRKNLLPFSARRAKRWKAALSVEDTTGLRICHEHFAAKDFQTVTSLYLKPSAVPTKRLFKLKTEPKRKRLPPEERPVYKSNRVCFVPGCSFRACEGIRLHSFPAETEKRRAAWIEAVKCPRLPTKNSCVCSKHFVPFDYLPGSKHLKKIAIPSQNLPEDGTFSGSVLIVKSDVNPEHLAIVKEEAEDPLSI